MFKCIENRSWSCVGLICNHYYGYLCFCILKQGGSEFVNSVVESYSHRYGILVALSVLIIRKLDVTTSVKWIGFPIVQVGKISTHIVMASKLPSFCGPMFRKCKKVWYHFLLPTLTTNLHLVLCSGQPPHCCC